MRVYHAHAICTYGSQQEQIEIMSIKANFLECTIVDPGSYENSVEKRNDGMEFCKRLVNTCDCLVFSRLFNKITAGVGKEINHALSQNKLVYELKDGKVERIEKSVKYISREDTIKLYNKWRMRNLY